MTRKSFQPISLLALAFILGGILVSPTWQTPTKQTTYVEPTLWSAEAETLAVIVTAADADSAAEAVEALGGQVDSKLWLIDAVAATVPASQLEALAAWDGIVSVVDNKAVKTAQAPWDGWITNYNIPVPWNGSPDAVPTHVANLWNLVNPASIDVGADKLHKFNGITGKGVSVAVLDSGLYFEKKTLNALGTKLDKLFLGQADFVGEGLCPSKGKQESGYCFTKKGYDSYDGFGHGSHVAGLIWSNFMDVSTLAYNGIAPEASILSVRVLGLDGTGSYADVIEGIQYVVENKETYNIRVMNLSLSAYATTPYFADPMNRAVEAAWAEGIVVLAAAGNTGSGAESVTVPGNDPYVITVGAINGNRTPGYWGDDIMPSWSATGPTWDGFAKPDVLAPGTYLVSFMYNDLDNIENSDVLVRQHPDNAFAATLFRMSGTSQATAVTSGVVALMLEAHPNLTPDQVKYRLMVSARPALTGDNDLVYNVLQQGMGRVWAPEAVLGTFDANNHANYGMDIQADLAHGLGWSDANGDGQIGFDELDPTELAYHYQGSIGRLTSDDGSAHLYYLLGKGDDSGATNVPVSVRDEFKAPRFDGNDGTGSWSGPWVEINEGDGPTSGDEQIVWDMGDTRLQVQDNDGGGEGVKRQVNLSGATWATLSFDYSRRQLDSLSDYVAVQVSANGGATWQELDRLAGPGNDWTYQPASYDLSPYISDQTVVRFVSSAKLGNNDQVFFDNVQIEYGGQGGALPAAAGEEIRLGKAGSTTACQGVVSDSGGSSGNYKNFENNGLLIEPANGSAAISLTFSQFELEHHYDYLKIYDGQNENGQLLASLTGRSFPPVLVATSGSMFIKFTSDFSVTE
ncbi:MAG: S8 family serine peptidase, partial [Anaerolineae bacterium]|nr:S8 family serine peptidase [Anaerolineae bacterium]